MIRPIRVVVIATVFWVVAVQLWGFVWRWESHLYLDQFIVLHFAIPVLLLIVVIGYHWVRRP